MCAVDLFMLGCVKGSEEKVLRQRGQSAHLLCPFRYSDGWYMDLGRVTKVQRDGEPSHEFGEVAKGRK
jgi:hypothetical protein